MGQAWKSGMPLPQARNDRGLAAMPSKSSNSPKRPVLLVSSSIGNHDSLHDIFCDSPWILHRTWDERHALETILNKPPEIGVVICEYSHRRYSWKSLLNGWKRTEFPPKLIVTSNAAEELRLAESLELGAFDFLLDSPFDQDEVLTMTKRAWIEWETSHPVNAL